MNLDTPATAPSLESMVVLSEAEIKNRKRQRRFLRSFVAGVVLFPLLMYVVSAPITLLGSWVWGIRSLGCMLIIIATLRVVAVSRMVFPLDPLEQPSSRQSTVGLASFVLCLLVSFLGYALTTVSIQGTLSSPVVWSA